ncbi:hypothetical protein N7510_004160 [Penicillium lagena]|uniref:uncharacterized protein n=1 Tax=Penicillium lagena TaxID=94218 RepID=UPI00253FDFA8|nr:uncharacterized protein N7510_004160 [Penicillium lagena]KAJ5620176.1 hypothetical protein N7510_004160 [Penicillium lagena]
MAGTSPHNPKERQDALNFAYMYGYPLLEYGKYVAQFPDACVNTLYHDRRLSTSDDLKIIRPNADTLYSTIFVDLSSNDLEITIPKISDRYWVIPFYDFYGNDIGNIGSLQGHQAGKYLVRYASEDFGFFLGSPPENQVGDDVLGYVNLPTAYGICLARFATTQAIQDQEAVCSYQDQIQLSSVSRHSGPLAPRLQLSTFMDPQHQPSTNVSVEQAILRLTASLAHLNPSPVLDDRQWISNILAKSGMKDGVFICPDGADISQVSAFADTQARDALRSPGGTMDYGNGWISAFPECMGNFWSNYIARYYIAKFGYLGLTSEQAIYPSRPKALRIKPNEAVLLIFSRRPVLLKTGFWSLTAYDADQYLVKNDMNRFILGDRDNMTFPDGTPLNDNSKNGEFSILLQPADVPPPAKWRNNWLPTPAGGGKMSITLRFYGATEEMMPKFYEYPRLEHIKAITESPKSLL